MAETASIALRVTDNMSAALTQIRSAMTPVRKDVQELQRELQTFSRTKVTLQVDLERAKQELKDAKAAFRDLEDEANQTRLEQAQEAYNNLTEQLQALNRASRQTVRDMEDVTNAVSRADNRAGSAMGGGSESGMLGQLAKAGLARQLGQSVSQFGGTLITSALGSEAGGFATSLLGGAATGAAMGSVAGPIGTAIGGAVGAISGAISGASQMYQQRDEAFKGVVQDRYNAVTAAQDESVTSGSAIASQREKDLISFSTLFGDKDTAKGYLSDLVGMANTTPFLYSDLTAMSKTLATYGYGANNILPTLSTIGDTGAALGMNTSDMSMVATALGRMKSSDKTTLEYLNILNDRGIGAVGMLADYYQVDQKTIYDRISKGQLAGGDTVDIILSALTERFSGAMERQSQTFEGKQSTLEGLHQEMDNAAGEGYNSTRLVGTQAEIDFLGGSGGEAMKDANRYIGQWKASLENLEEELNRDAMRGVMGQGISDRYRDENGSLTGNGKRLQELAGEYRKYSAEAEAGNQEAGAELGRILAEAQVIAQNEYFASDGYRLQLETQKKLAQDIRNDTALKGEYWNTGYEMGQEFSKGFASVWNPHSDAVSPGSNAYIAGGGSQSGTAASPYAAGLQVNGSHASGLKRVPYDNYVALLHEGERVLTASEARQTDAGGGVVVNVSGNQFTVRSDADIDAIAQAIAEEIRLQRQSGTL